MIDRQKLEEIRQEIEFCRKCNLCNYRQNTVPGWFPETTEPLLFIGEAPSIMDDYTGKPLLGSHGKNFNNTIEKTFGLTREQYSIIYCAKCITLKAGERSRPSPNTLLWCASYLYAQIEAFDPKLIITLGHIPQFIFKNQEDIRFSWHDKENYSQDIGKLFKTKSMISDKEFYYVPIYDPYSWTINTKIKNASIQGLKEAKKIYDSI